MPYAALCRCPVHRYAAGRLWTVWQADNRFCADHHLTASKDNSIYIDSRMALESRLKRISGFFGDVVLRFVLQDLTLLLVSFGASKDISLGIDTISSLDKS
jgi:hypothetical protein